MKLQSLFLRPYYEAKRAMSLRGMLKDMRPIVVRGLFTPPFVLRDGTRLELNRSYYDYLVFWENYCKREYEKYVPEGFDPKVILDIGAHKGFFTNAITRRFPNAKIYAIEPSSENFAILVRNTAHLPNVECINAAVWKESGTVQLNTESSNSVSHSIIRRGSADGAQTVKAITMQELPKADFIKSDIEGAEHHLIFDCAYLALEVHEDEGFGFDSYVKKLRSEGYKTVIVEGAIVYALK